MNKIMIRGIQSNDDTWYLTVILISLIWLKRLIFSLESKDQFQFYSVIVFEPCKGTVLLVIFWLAKLLTREMVYVLYICRLTCSVLKCCYSNK
jgi:hypothetical protein